ncbi:hypothetical protein AB0K15_18905 [Amycolatopsis sp. NPDC049253]|uniref:hypothetical protein n=1 Tax=Amycolatopsis sp. NPDC049253 TaxID=3155274 RepID=UPI00341BB436
MVRKVVQAKIAQLKDEWAASGAEVDALLSDQANWTGTGRWSWNPEARPCKVKGCIRTPKNGAFCRKHGRGAR